MKKFTILVCLYKKEVCNSPTLQSLLKNQFVKNEFRLYVWDNSPDCLPEASRSLLKMSFPDFTYKHCPSNQVLSKLYNQVMDEIGMNDGYLILCDDDTQIPTAYFEEVLKNTNLYPEINLFLPKIISVNQMISPARDYLIFTKFIKNLTSGLFRSKNMTAINSGMVICNRVFREGIRYDERLKFYGTDNYFMHQYSLRYEMLYVLDVEILHNISFNTSSDVTNKIRIFKETKRSNKIIYNDNVIKKYLIMLNNFAVSIKLCIKYKTSKFLYD